MHSRIDGYDVALGLGVLCVVGGVSLWSIPGGLIVFGLFLFGGAVRGVRVRGGAHGSTDAPG